jgi:hypothetical protein
MPFLNFDTLYGWFGDNQLGNPWRVPFLDRKNIYRPDSGESLIPCNVATLAFPILDLQTANGAIVSVEPLPNTAMPGSGTYSVIQTGGSGGVVTLQVNGPQGGLPILFTGGGGSGYTTGYATLTGGYPVYIGVNSSINSDMSKVALPNLTTEEAGANGDVRKVYFAIIDQLAQAYLDKATANRPAKMVVTKSTSVNATTGVLTTNYSFQFQLYSTGLEVVNES